MSPLGSRYNPYNESDSDEDEDYIPPEGRDSDSEQSEQEDNGKTVDVSATEKPVDEGERKRAREALWSSFQASAANASKCPDQQAPPRKMIKIQRRYLFAGDEVIDVVEVLEDSAEAKKWPLWKDPEVESTATPPSISQNATVTTTATATEDAPPGSSSSLDLTQSTPTASTAKIASAPTKPPNKRPGPRKPKISLAPLPGSAKAKKLTTLDKSAMDWRTHLQAEQEAGSSVKDELEANRRGGGYLEKVEFLKRVEERREENLDSLKDSFTCFLIS
ncbi:bucentaur or craniofacial development-domain-containing protein [Flammula alnicola]|nr:bucentaur or craniofacial development-domain-containing protein [Flammula alnicola]